MTSKQPSRNVLMCVSGMSPAVITETLYALVTQTPAFVPDEIHVLTTLEGRQKVLKQLLDAETGQFHAFMRDYLPTGAVRFDDSTVHVISQHRSIKAPVNPFAAMMTEAQPTVTEVVELDDIITDVDNKAAADTLYRVMRELKAQPGTRLHASVAGGRKSMSFYMGHAFSLLAEPEDSLSHVLVNAPFENPRLNFFYPPRTPVTLSCTDALGVMHEASTADAEIQLAELSVLKLGGLLGQNWPAKAQDSFAFAVRLAQDALVVPELRVVLSSIEGRHCGWLEICGERIDLPPLQFAVFALHALASKYQDELPEGAQLRLQDLPPELWDALSQDLDGSRFATTTDFKPARARIQESLREVIGPVAQHFVIETVGTKAKGSTRPYALMIDPAHLKLVGLQGWWPLLRNALT